MALMFHGIVFKANLFSSGGVGEALVSLSYESVRILISHRLTLLKNTPFPLEISASKGFLSCGWNFLYLLVFMPDWAFIVCWGHLPILILESWYM